MRKIIYTTNAIESLHMQLRKVLKNRGHFPSDEAATKLIYLALRNITKSWKNPPLTWRMAANQFAIQFGERFTNEAYAFGMGATRPLNPAARGERLGATAPWQNRSQPEKNKPALNTKLRILPLSTGKASEFLVQLLVEPTYCARAKTVPTVLR